MINRKLRSSLPLIKRIIIVVLLGSMLACESDPIVNKIEDVSFETSTYYPSFLFAGERNDTITKTLKFQFNDWAIQQNSGVQLGLYDEKDNLIDSNNTALSLLVNGGINSSGKIDLDSQTDSDGKLEISLFLAPNTKTTEHNGYIKVLATDLNRINNISQLMGSPILSWSATQHVIWNPLKKYLIIGLCVLLGILLIWLIFLRPIVYTRFKRSSFTIQSPHYKRIRLHNAIGLTLTNHNLKQNWKDKFFKGKDLNYSNPFFQDPIRVMPHSRNKVRIQMGPTYAITPFTTNLDRGAGVYIITNLKTKEKISITYG